MFNLCIKHMNKVLDYYKTYEVEEYHKFVIFEIKYVLNVLIIYIYIYIYIHMRVCDFVTIFFYPKNTVL